MLTGFENDLIEEQLLLLLLPGLDDNLHAYSGIDVERLNWTMGALGATMPHCLSMYR